MVVGLLVRVLDLCAFSLCFSFLSVCPTYCKWNFVHVIRYLMFVLLQFITDFIRTNSLVDVDENVLRSCVELEEMHLFW